MKIMLAVLLMTLSQLSFGKCYEGLDCPEDTPGYNNNKPPVNPPPPPAPNPNPYQTYQQPAQPPQDCSNPYMGLLGMLYGGTQTKCTQPATHCCFENGRAVPLVYPGSIAYGANCHAQTNVFGIAVPINGLGCRR